MSTFVQYGELYYFEHSPLSFSSENEPPFLSPMNEPTKTLRRFGRRKCKVCGDEACGYHYGVMACNGCGSFFRRSVLSGRNFVCSRGGFCSLTKDVRCACRACRFAKCKAVGMSSDFPSNPFRNTSWDDEPEAEETYNLPLTPPIVGLHVEHMKQLDILVQRELDLLSSRDASINKSCSDYPLQYLLESYPFIQNNMSSILVGEQRNISPFIYWNAIDLFFTVEFAKSFQEFQSFTISDQMILLRKTAGVIQLLTQSFYSYQRNSNFLMFPDGSVPEYSNNEKNYQEFYSRGADICRRLNMKLQDFVLIKTLALFTDNVELSSSARELIQNKREESIRLLSMYMFSQFDPSEGSQKMSNCLLSLSSFININENRRNYWYCLHLTNKEVYPQLIQELFFTNI